MYRCKECQLSFENAQAKANHVRWKHKKNTFTEEGKRSLREKVSIANSKRHGKQIVETIDCPKCGTPFERKYRKIEKAKKFCSRSCANSRDWSSHPDRERIRKARRNAALSNPSWQSTMGNVSENERFSSKAERNLAEKLGDEFFRHKKILLDSGTAIDVDIAHIQKDIWIESDGPYHFEKVHVHHDFQRSKKRDEEQNAHCLNNDILLIRVNNFKFSIQQQAQFVKEQIAKWDGTGRVVELY
jgi:rubredoxin